jgi:hypothetical protein
MTIIIEKELKEEEKIQEGLGTMENFYFLWIDNMDVLELKMDKNQLYIKVKEDEDKKN